MNKFYIKKLSLTCKFTWQWVGILIVRAWQVAVFQRVSETEWLGNGHSLHRMNVEGNPSPGKAFQLIVLVITILRQRSAGCGNLP